MGKVCVCVEGRPGKAKGLKVGKLFEVQVF